MPYLPALDGLRAIAILLVLLFHARMPFLPGANVGVDLFFVLSGYLITRILLVEYQSSGALDLGRFYRQRLWRLTPPLLLLLLLYFLFGPWLWPDYGFHLHDLVVVLIYQADLSLVFGMGPEKLTHAWSLAIEERFYLLWPLALLGLLALRWRRMTLVLLFSSALLAVFWRMGALQFWGVSSGEAYYRFDMRLSGLLWAAFFKVVVASTVFSGRLFLRLLFLLPLGVECHSSDRLPVACGT